MTKIAFARVALPFTSATRLIAYLYDIKTSPPRIATRCFILYSSYYYTLVLC